jgi:selenoprotein W-related protein
LDRAVSAASDILGSYQHVIDSFTFNTGSKGVFDVRVDGDLIYSKAETGRHAEPGEVFELFKARFGEGVTPYGT